MNPVCFLGCPASDAFTLNMQPIDNLPAEDVSAQHSSPASCEELDRWLLKEQQQQTATLQSLSHLPAELKEVKASGRKQLVSGVAGLTRSIRFMTRCQMGMLWNMSRLLDVNHHMCVGKQRSAPWENGGPWTPKEGAPQTEGPYQPTN